VVHLHHTEAIMKTQYLTPATKDAPGQLIEVQHSDGGQQQFLTPDGQLVTAQATTAVQSNAPQQYAEPVPYFAENLAEVAELRAKVQQAEAALRLAQARKSQAMEVARLEAELQSAKDELDAAEYPKREQRKRESGTGRDDAPPTRNTAQIRNTGALDTWLARFDAEMLAKARAKGVFWGPYQPTT
jgi:hypothetical protein